MIHRRLLLLSLILTGTGLVRAETPAPAGSGSPESSPAASARFPTDRLHSVIFTAIDLDHNGVLSAAELANAPTALRALDLNDDGQLSADELRRFEQRQPAVATETRTARDRTGRVSPGFMLAFTLDANHDGVIQTMEIANAATSLRSLDANGDDQLTPSELRAVQTVAHNAR